MLTSPATETFAVRPYAELSEAHTCFALPASSSGPSTAGHTLPCVGYGST